MSLPSLAQSIPAHALPGRTSNLPILKAAGERPVLDEGTETGPPAAATERAETAFEFIGITLILVIVIAAAWIMIRHRR